MNDTSPEIEALQNRLLMERSGEERLLMALSMCRTARAIVRSSLAAELSDAERRVRIFLRLYGDEFDDAARDEIIARIRDGG